MFQKGANLTSEFLYKDNEMIDIEDEIDIFELYTLNTLLHSEFTLIEEEPEEIDIQEIEAIGKMLGWAKISLENNVEEQKESINFSLDFYGSKINEIIENQNILLGAVKQLDRKIGKSNEKNVQYMPRGKR